MRRSWIERLHPVLSISSQCALAGVNRSSWYYPARVENEENLVLMRLLDEQYTRTPFYGSTEDDEVASRPGLAHQSEASSTLDAFDVAWRLSIQNRASPSRLLVTGSTRICCED